ncbi:uncharacterized protein LOC136084860 [Hydra vulgaris]|uniref:Uncharacterized protein LOC136084860 n=1 Tax=Hydra vulgaris TaxID=6087 RepID=A0ABM4CK23_HYDVU
MSDSDSDDSCHHDAKKKTSVKKYIKEMKKEMSQNFEERKVLINLDLFVLDNSLRETTVGALRGHTLQNKFEIYEQIKKVGFQHCIVASFSHMTDVCDTFVGELRKRGEDMSMMYAFTEFANDANSEGIPLSDLPVGLKKCKQLGIKNVIIEADLVYYKYDYEKFDHNAMCALFIERFEWIRNNLSNDSNILVNLRDLPDALNKVPERALKMVEFLASYRPQIFAIITEESGKYLPEELGVWIRTCKKVMNDSKFNGHFLIHVHQQWGMLDATQIECLANGCTGIWAGVCEEGASMGHASSCLTIMNLVRMGNKKVLKKFHCEELRNAAIEVTRITTGKDPHPKQTIYGARALDQVFGLPQFDPTKAKDIVGDFDMAKFFGQEATMRISILADEVMILTRMKRLFGDHPSHTFDIAKKMRALMNDELRANRKEEYHSPMGLAMLFDRAGGKLTTAMTEAIALVNNNSVNIDRLIGELYEQWKQWDLRDGKADDRLTFDNFYDGFMKGYFGCYRCSEAQQCLKAINANDDLSIDWKEFSVFLKWAGYEYPETKTSEELLDIAFRKGIIPAMQDELIRMSKAIVS